MDSKRGKKIYSIFFIVENFKPEIALLIDEIISGNEKILDEKACRILGAKLVEDESKLVIMVEAFKDLNEKLSSIKERLSALLLSKGIRVSSSFMSEVEDVVWDPSRDSYISLLKKKIVFSIQLIEKIVKNQLSSQEELCSFLLGPLENFNFDKKRICKRYLTTLNDKIKYLTSIKWLRELDGDKLKILITRLFSLLLSNENDINKLSTIMKLKANEIYNLDLFLHEKGFILINKKTRLTEKGQALVDNLISTYEIYKRTQAEFLQEYISEFLNNLNSTISTVLRRDGSIERFSVEKLIFSLLNAGIKPNLLAQTLSRILIQVIGENIVTTDDLSNAVIRSLMQIDDKGEVAARYLFLLKTRKIVFVREDKSISPLTYNYLKTIVKEIIEENIDECFIPDSFIKSLVEEVYDGLRSIMFHPPISIVFQHRYPSMILDKNDLVTLVDLYLKSYFPVLKMLKDMNKLSLMKKFIEETINHLDLAVEMLSSESKGDTFQLIINSVVEKSISTIALHFSILPSWSTIRNISVIEHFIKVNASRDVNNKFLRRVNSFLNLSKRVFIKTLRNETGPPFTHQLKQYLQLCRKLMEELKAKYNL